MDKYNQFVNQKNFFSKFFLLFSQPKQFMSTKTVNGDYVGEKIRREIKARRYTNGVLIQALVDAGIPLSDTRFSNKIYGRREKFNEREIRVINSVLKTKFEFVPEE